MVVRNYGVDDSASGGSLRVTADDCVVASPGPNGPLNHVEVRVAQNQIDVYATDAGTSGPLHHLATIGNANLSFTRGLIWLEDAHYNADKFGCHCQGQHTFTWDNVGFDGPLVARDLAFDANDALKPAGNGQTNLGWFSGSASAPAQVQINNVTGIGSAAGGLLTFNFYYYTAPQSLTYSVNGHKHTVGMPYTDTSGNQIRTLSVPVPLSEVVSGTNTVSISGDQPLAIANIDLIMVGASVVPHQGVLHLRQRPRLRLFLRPRPRPFLRLLHGRSFGHGRLLKFFATSGGGTPCGDNRRGARLPGGWVARAYKFTASGTGSASKLHVFLGSTSSSNQVLIGVYTNSSSNQPATLLTEGSVQHPQAGAWNSVSVPAIQIQNGASYWLALLQPSGSAGRIAIQGSSQVGSVATSSATNLTILPNSWTSAQTSSQQVAMVFAN